MNSKQCFKTAFATNSILLLPNTSTELGPLLLNIQDASICQTSLIPLYLTTHESDMQTTTGTSGITKKKLLTPSGNYTMSRMKFPPRDVLKHSQQNTGCLVEGRPQESQRGVWGQQPPREMHKLTRTIFETCRHEEQTMLNNSNRNNQHFIVTKNKHRIWAAIAKLPRCTHMLDLFETIVFNNT